MKPMTPVQALIGACLFAGALGCSQVPSSTSPTAALTGESSSLAPGVGTSSAERRVLADDQLGDLDEARAAMPERIPEADADKLLVDLGDVKVDESQTYDVQASRSSGKSSSASRSSSQSSHRSSAQGRARIHRGMDHEFRDNFRNFRYFRYNNYYFPYYYSAGYYVPYIYPYTYTNAYGFASPYAAPFLYDQGGLYSPYSYVYGSVAPVTNTVTVSDFSFAPAVVRVPVGSTVTWQFNGPSPHTTTSATNVMTSVRWDSGIQRAGQTYSVRFDQRGSFDYTCKLHPAMRGTVIVN